MRVELIKLHASGNAMRGSEILSIVEESLEGNACRLPSRTDTFRTVL